MTTLRGAARAGTAAFALYVAYPASAVSGLGVGTYAPGPAFNFLNIVNSAIPVPPALVLFGTALVGFVGFARRRRQTA